MPVKKTALLALSGSGLRCIISPLIFFNVGTYGLFLLMWGLLVIADSPLFSTMVAKTLLLKIKERL